VGKTITVNKLIDNRYSLYNEFYKVSISDDLETIINTDKGITTQEWDDFVYCVTVPTHNFVIRRNDKVSITGNCHVKGLTKLFRTFCGEHPHIVNDDFKKRIYDMARKVYELEERFIDLSFKNYEIQGLTKEEVKSYVKFITDRRLIELGLKPNFKQKTNPLEWVDWLINGSDHSNFFEKRVTEYDTHGLTGDWSDAYE
jgi:ribonucleotide reductase beta subunit family protein with ferritin-like domain